MADPAGTLSRKLKEYIELEKGNAQRLSKATGIHRVQLYQYAAGTKPGIDKAVAIAHAMGLSISALVDEAPSPTNLAHTPQDCFNAVSQVFQLAANPRVMAMLQKLSNMKPEDLDIVEGAILSTEEDLSELLEEISEDDNTPDNHAPAAKRRR
jgi:transcriptional regulator with XRE-family HTH domain